MNENSARPYCKRPVACVAGSRGKCRMCHKKRPPADIIAYHNNGKRTLAECAKRFGRTWQNIQRLLKSAGVTARKQPHRSHKDMTTDQRRLHRKLCRNGVPAAIAHEQVRIDR